MQPETITLERTGYPPLKFVGTLLTSACGQFVQPPKDKPNADYFTVSLYRVAGDRQSYAGTPGDRGIPLFVIQIVYTKTFRDTQEHHFAQATDDPAGTLTNYDPLATLIGFPPGEAFAERQNALEAKLRRQYDVLVSAVLRDFPVEVSPSRSTDCETVTVAELERCAAQLGRSEAGRATLYHLLGWLDHDDIHIDRQNQEAIFTLLEGEWGAFSGTTRDLMREQLHRGQP